MTREEQYEILSNTFALELDLHHYEIAFRAHYKLLNELIEISAEHMKVIELPRVEYARYYEYVCLIYSQVCITVECLLKALLIKNGENEKDIRKNNHNLVKLLEAIGALAEDKCKIIYSLLIRHKAVLELLTVNNMFVDTRYMQSKDCIAVEHINIIWNLIKDIDKAYYEMYKDFNIINNVYPDSMVDED